jgi:hypothetical protein
MPRSDAPANHVDFFKVLPTIGPCFRKVENGFVPASEARVRGGWAMGTEIDNATEFEDLAKEGADTPTAIALLG